MSFYSVNSYQCNNIQEPQRSSTNIFDTTKSNYRNENIPEIGTTIYNTIPTGDDIFVNGSSDNETETRSIRETGSTRGCGKSYNVLKSRSRRQSSEVKIRSNSVQQNEMKSAMKRRRSNEITRRNYKNNIDRKNSAYNDLRARALCNHNNSDRENISRSASSHRNSFLGRFLYDGTYSIREYSSLSSRSREVANQSETSPHRATSPDIPVKKTKTEHNTRLTTNVADLTSNEAPKCLLQPPISVITEQRVCSTTRSRQLWLLSTIYIYSSHDPTVHFNIEHLERTLEGAPILNREMNELEWDKRPQSFKEEVFVKNNIIKIRRSRLFCAPQDGKQITITDRRSYDHLCGVEVNNVSQNDNVSLRPQSMLNITSMRDENRSIRGNIRLVEKLTLTLFVDKDSQTNHRLQNQIEERIIKPKNYHIPVRYTEEVRVNQRRIDINRETEIKSTNGLTDSVRVEQPEAFEFREIRRYNDSASELFGSPMSGYPIQQTMPQVLGDEQIRQVKEVTTQTELSHSSRSRSEVTDKQLREQIPVEKAQSGSQTQIQVIERLDNNGMPVINSTAESQVTNKQKEHGDSMKQEKTDLRSRKGRLFRRGLRRSSRWSRFTLSKSQKQPGSIESVRTVPATFSPLGASTPVKKSPTIAKVLSDRSKLMMEKYVKTSRSQSSGTGTHIRSTLDCDITLNTTKQVDVTEIPIGIKGVLSGLPWCTTIRLRVKHDANEKPTFIPKQLSLNQKILWQNEHLQEDQSKDTITAAKKMIID